jgi:hypothetical protein
MSRAFAASVRLRGEKEVSKSFVGVLIEVALFPARARAALRACVSDPALNVVKNL